MDLKALVKAIQQQIGASQASYISEGILIVCGARIVVCGNLVKCDTVSMRCDKPKQLLRALQHEGILDISEGCIDKIVHTYNLMTNPFLNKTKQSKIKLNEFRSN